LIVNYIFECSSRWSLLSRWRFFIHSREEWNFSRNHANVVLHKNHHKWINRQSHKQNFPRKKERISPLTMSLRKHFSHLESAESDFSTLIWLSIQRPKRTFFLKWSSLQHKIMSPTYPSLRLFSCFPSSQFCLIFTIYWWCNVKMGYFNKEKFKFLT